jgi:DNA-binding MarR family transcriptional regulator
MIRSIIHLEPVLPSASATRTRRARGSRLHVQRASKYKPLLTAEERQAWRGLLHAYAAISRALDDDLRLQHGLTDNSFEVLGLLALSDDQRLRMVELANLLVFTRSGVTRLVERLERDGYVARCRDDDDDDGRTVYAALTEQGFEIFQAAAPTHVAILRELFYDKLEAGTLAELNRVWDRLTPHSCSKRESKLRSADRDTR